MSAVIAAIGPENQGGMVPFLVPGQIQSGEHPDFPAGSFEFGDAVHWAGAKIYLSGSTDPYFSYVDFFEIGWGKWSRHPNPKLTYNGFGADPRCVSRDAMIHIWAGIIAEENQAAAWRFFLRHGTRGWLFAFNTIHNGVVPANAKRKWPDLCGPTVWGLALRGTGLAKHFMGTLEQLDKWLVIDTTFQNYLDAEDDSECISYLITLIVANEHYPTKYSRIAMQLLDLKDAERELVRYWDTWRKHGEMVSLYLRKLEHLKQVVKS